MLRISTLLATTSGSTFISRRAARRSHCGNELKLEKQEENEHWQRSQHRGCHEQIILGVIHVDHARDSHGEGELRQ
jgi:hypothetical protein